MLSFPDKYKFLGMKHNKKVCGNFSSIQNMLLSHNLVNFVQNVLTDTYYNDVHDKQTCYMECYGYCKSHKEIQV
jgi:hypothetical protein